MIRDQGRSKTGGSAGTGRHTSPRTPRWSQWLPITGLAMVPLHTEAPSTAAVVVASVILIGCVIAAVHHGEIIAHKVGEPFGTLVLAGAVTVIEASLILAMMLSGSANPDLPRDTVFAAIMLILNGLVGGCLLMGGIRHGEQKFVLEGVNAALCVLAAMAILVLVLPGVATDAPATHYSPAQLSFTALVSTILYGTFIFVQTIRHRDYFLPEGTGDLAANAHAAPPSRRTVAASVFLLVASLVSVIFLAKALSGPVEAAVAAAALPRALVGILIASLVLAPESVAALRAARRNRLQTSLNLALGSALATIGLTIPVIAIAALASGWPLSLALDPESMTLLALSLGVAILSFGTGRTTILQGAVHLVLLAAYVFTTAT
jgi:Ca2+:H+ antiporter